MSLALLRDWIATPFSDRRLVSNFARQEFYAQFTASMGGFLWLILTPIANISIYAFVFSYIFKVRAAEGFGETAFVLFMMIGYLPWFAFADAMGRSTSLLLEKAPLITKVKFPVQVIPVVGSLVPYLTHAIGCCCIWRPKAMSIRFGYCCRLSFFYNCCLLPDSLLFCRR